MKETVVHLTLKSSNKKVGEIPVSTSSKNTCPDSCPLKENGCYADGGPLRIHWDKVSQCERGMSYREFLKAIENLPIGQLWRHNQAGDLVGYAKNQISMKALMDLCQANEGKCGWTYTHYPVIGEEFEGNRNAIKCANNRGFVINLSADSIDEADRLVDLMVGPVCTVLPSDTTTKCITPKGRTIIPCPAALDKVKSCAECKLCQKVGRKSIIGFPAHGFRRKNIDRFLNIEVN